MTGPETAGLDRFAFLATFVAGRAVAVGRAPIGEAAHTDGRVVYVAGDHADEQRREVLVQSALLGAGSLDPTRVRALRGRPTLARRYLAVEGQRVLAELAARLPLAAALHLDGTPSTQTADESLEIARCKTKLTDPPDWFGIIRPSRLLGPSGSAGTKATSADLRPGLKPSDTSEDDDGEQAQESKILKLFENPLTNSSFVADFLKRLFGASRQTGNSAAGGELRVGSARRMFELGAHARPPATRIRFTDDEKPGAAVRVGGALHPEWDVFNDRYRPDWCRVVDFPLSVEADLAAAGVTPDEVLKRRLARVGLGLKVLRARPDGDELDIGAVIDLFVDLRCGHSPPEHVYAERRKLARNLGVLILLDASGSATDTDSGGLTVHDHQRRAAATLAVTLEELGDRVAVYAFRSQSRHAVHLLRIKTFAQRFSAVGQARLQQLEPSGYTRLGAGIRGAGEILKTQAGTPNRLLVVLSDGFPYDDGYEGRYAEADANKALEELRADGLACLCLSIGASTGADSLQRVFGSASYASAATLNDLSPRMDELFLSSLRELAAPTPR